MILYFYALLAMSLYSAFGFRSINEANHLKFLHKVRDHKMKVRFDFRTYHFFCSGIVLITLAGTMNTFFHFLLLFYEAKSKEFWHKSIAFFWTLIELQILFLFFRTVVHCFVTYTSHGVTVLYLQCLSVSCHKTTTMLVNCYKCCILLLL